MTEGQERYGPARLLVERAAIVGQRQSADAVANFAAIRGEADRHDAAFAALVQAAEAWFAHVDEGYDEVVSDDDCETLEAHLDRGDVLQDKLRAALDAVKETGDG